MQWCMRAQRESFSEPLLICWPGDEAVEAQVDDISDVLKYDAWWYHMLQMSLAMAEVCNLW